LGNGQGPAEAGARVLLHGRDRARLEPRLVELKAAGFAADVLAFDVVDRAAMASAWAGHEGRRRSGARRHRGDFVERRRSRSPTLWIRNRGGRAGDRGGHRRAIDHVEGQHIGGEPRRLEFDKRGSSRAPVAAMQQGPWRLLRPGPWPFPNQGRAPSR